MQNAMCDLESRFTAIRGELRLLRGKLDVKLVAGVPQVVDGFVSAEEKNARELRRLVGQAIALMDRYEDAKMYHEEFEKHTVKLTELVSGNWKEASQDDDD